jgi:hypothetical protein
MDSIQSLLCDEIVEIITKHVAELRQYIPTANYRADGGTGDILACLERLNQICQYSPQQTPFKLYGEACECHENLQAFLRAMNQPIDAAFRETNFGRLFLQAGAWRRTAAQQYRLTTKDVWELIAPTKPDHLEALRDGQYEARWWKPVPIMDIEILKYTEGVLICGEPFEPEGLIGGLAVRFSISIGD